MEADIEEKVKDNNPYHIYDNAFLSACAWDKRLLIPLVNEIFKKNISENAEIERSPNEYTSHQKTGENEEHLVKRITDALVKVDGGKYHFECESKNDGEILIRIAEYDMQIGLSGAAYQNHVVRIEMPDTAVVFLRKHKKLPKDGIIIYYKGDESLTQHVPYFEITDYGLEYLSDKHLYILLPFYLMRYEHAIARNISSKFAMIEKEADCVYNILTNAFNDKLISEKEYEDIVTLCNDVVKEISKGSQISERLVEIMGSEVLKTAEERGIEKGIEKGIDKGLDKGLKATVELLKDYCPDFEALYKKIVANATYSYVTREQVKRYY